MDISALQSMISTASARSISSSPAQQSTTVTASTQSSKDVYESKLAEIASKYDVKHMTADQVGSMAQELKDNGLISTPDFLRLSLLPYLMKDGDGGAKAAMTKEGTVDLKSYWDIVSVKPSDADSGQKLFDALMKSKDENASQSSIKNKAVASYADAINNSSFDANRIANVLNALEAHSPLQEHKYR